MQDKIFIEVEGADYSGKTTLIGNLVNRLGIIDHWFTREPYKEEYRNALLNEPLKRDDALEVFVKDRIEHVKKMRSVPQKYIWCDRYLLSTLVYQTEDEDDVAAVIKNHDENDLPYPDILVYMFCSKEVAQERALERSESNHYDKDYKKNMQRYRKVMSSKATPYYSRIPVIEIDTSRDNPDAIARKVWEAVRKKVLFAD